MAAVSRKLERPLGIVVQSSSAAGKSILSKAERAQALELLRDPKLLERILAGEKSPYGHLVRRDYLKTYAD